MGLAASAVLGALAGSAEAREDRASERRASERRASERRRAGGGGRHVNASTGGVKVGEDPGRGRRGPRDDTRRFSHGNASGSSFFVFCDVC